MPAQDELKQVALKDKDWYVRQKAVAKITDQEVLKQVALKDKDSDVRQKAVAKITDQDFLKQVALEDKDWDIINTAFHAITNQKILKGLILVPKLQEHGAVFDALERVNDVDFLKDLAKNARNKSLVRRYAQKRIRALLAKEFVPKAPPSAYIIKEDIVSLLQGVSKDFISMQELKQLINLGSQPKEVLLKVKESSTPDGKKVDVSKLVRLLSGEDVEDVEVGVESYEYESDYVITLNLVGPILQDKKFMRLHGKLKHSEHPGNKKTVAWALMLQPSKYAAILNEVQSDTVVNEARIRSQLKGDADFYLEKLKEHDFYSWPYMLMNTVIKYCRTAGIKKLFMSTPKTLFYRWGKENVPEEAARLFYEKLPRKYKFVPGKYGGKKLWLLDLEKYKPAIQR